MLKRNRGYIILLILVCTLIYQVMLNMTANKMEDRLDILEKNLNTIKRQIGEDK